MKVLVVRAISAALTAGARCARIKVVHWYTGELTGKVTGTVIATVSGTGARCARIPGSG